MNASQSIDPHEFVRILAAGRSIDACAHTFVHIDDEGLWCRNPHGLDAYFGRALPSVHYAREILVALSRGTVFGAVPRRTGD
ncbi:hypothetical protein ACNSZF_09045 [Burkholderia gladioli]